MKYSNIPDYKSAIVFELDDVLLPKKDYDLQVYYLFANFVEYLETFPPAQELLGFMTKRYQQHGELNMFEEAASVFGLDKKYKENLQLLFSNAKLPLKLLLFKDSLELLQELVVNRKQIFLLTAGNPQQQLNKIRQTEWHGLDQYLKVYFADEFDENSHLPGLNHLLNDTQLTKSELLIVRSENQMEDLQHLTDVDVMMIR